MNSQKQYEYQYNIQLVGDQAVGKTSLIERYINNTFMFNSMGTAGIDVKSKIHEMSNQKIKICFYDTAGQDRFRNIATKQCMKANGIIIVYDVTDRKSFDGVNMWMNSLKAIFEKGVEGLLIGNKIDMTSERIIPTGEGAKLALQYNIPFIETSAKESSNVKEAFLHIIKKIFDREYETKLPEKKKKKNSGCCYAAS